MKKISQVLSICYFFVFLPHIIHVMKKGTYKTKKQNHSVVQEPLATYGISHNPVVINDSVIPDGYMSLEQFGEIFHQKLDANYENLQSNRFSILDKCAFRPVNLHPSTEAVSHTEYSGLNPCSRNIR